MRRGTKGGVVRSNHSQEMSTFTRNVYIHKQCLLHSSYWTITLHPRRIPSPPLDVEAPHLLLTSKPLTSSSRRSPSPPPRVEAPPLPFDADSAPNRALTTSRASLSPRPLSAHASPAIPSRLACYSHSQPAPLHSKTWKARVEAGNSSPTFSRRRRKPRIDVADSLASTSTIAPHRHRQ